MATTQSTQQQRDHSPWTSLEGDSEGEKVESWFDDIIWHHPLVCSECFALLKETVTDERDDWGNDATQTWRSEAAFLGRDVVAKTVVGERTARHDDGQVDGTEPIRTSTSTYDVVPRTTCGECGSVGGLSLEDTLAKQAAVDRVPSLVDRLREQGFAVDVDTVYGVVRRFKSSQDHHADDKRIFATAAAMGVGKA